MRTMPVVNTNTVQWTLLVSFPVLAMPNTVGLLLGVSETVFVARVRLEWVIVTCIPKSKCMPFSMLIRLFHHDREMSL